MSTTTSPRIPLLPPLPTPSVRRHERLIDLPRQRAAAIVAAASGIVATATAVLGVIVLSR